MDSDPKIIRRYTPDDFSTFRDKLRGSVTGFLLKAGLKGEFRAHLFNDQYVNKGPNGHQRIWRESENVNSMVLAVRTDGDKICLVRLWLPKTDDSNEKEIRSAISTALEPKGPTVDPPALPPPKPAPPPLPSSDRKQDPKKKELPEGKFSLKGWLTESANLTRVLLTLRAFLEKKDGRRAPGKVLVGALHSSDVLPKTKSLKSFNLIGKLLKDMDYLEEVVVDGKKKFLRLTLHAQELLQKHQGSANLPSSPKPSSPSETVLGRMHDRKAAELFKLISVKMAELTSTFEQLAKHLGGEAG